MPKSPTVSIIIPAYNAIAFIQRAVDSCLAQTYTDTEIIVVDDGSSDGTGAFVQSHYGQRVQLITQTNHGIPYTHNIGVRAARGTFVKPLDADDALHPTYLEQVMKRFEQVDEQVALVYTQHQIIDQSIITIAPTNLIEGDVFCRLLREKNQTMMLPSTVTIRKDALIAVGMYPESYYSVDWDTWLRLATRYHFAAIDEVLVDRYLHDDNISKNSLRSVYQIIRTLEKTSDYPARQACLNDAEYGVMLADLCHKAAMLEWQAGQSATARHYLQRATQLSVQSRRLRQLYIGLTYIAPYAVIQQLNRLLALRAS